MRSWDVLESRKRRKLALGRVCGSQQPQQVSGGHPSHIKRRSNCTLPVEPHHTRTTHTTKHTPPLPGRRVQEAALTCAVVPKTVPRPKPQPVANRKGHRNSSTIGGHHSPTSCTKNRNKYLQLMCYIHVNPYPERREDGVTLFLILFLQRSTKPQKSRIFLYRMFSTCNCDSSQETSPQPPPPAAIATSSRRWLGCQPPPLPEAERATARDLSFLTTPRRASCSVPAYGIPNQSPNP